jgi:hypothetical protein
MTMTLNNLIAALAGLDDDDLIELRDSIDEELEDRGADDLDVLDEGEDEEDEDDETD